MSLPFGPSPDYDLIADLDGTLHRIQVKTGTYRTETSGGGSRYQVQLATLGGNQSWTGLSKHLDPSRIDFIFILVGDGRRWLIPASALEARTAVTVGGPRYSEYEIASGQPIENVVYGGESGPSRIDGPARGSAGVGEPGRPVKSVATPEWVRIPPPPLPGLDGDVPPKFRRTRMSSGHQVTIPRYPFGEAGLEVGDRFEVTADGPGRIVLERIEAPSITLGPDGLDAPSS